MSTCKWPGCEAWVQHGSLCGEHQLAMKTALGPIHSICTEMHLDKDYAIRWTAKFAPHIMERPTPHGPWIVTKSLPNQFAVKTFALFGSTRRIAYQRARRLRVDGMVPTDALIQAIIAEDQWLTVRETAEKISIPHRYLRHLIYEDEVPSIVRLSSTNPLVKNHLGFVKQVIPDLKSEMTRVDKRREH